MKQSPFSQNRMGLDSPWILGQSIIWIIVFILSVITAFVLRYSDIQTSSLPLITFFINAIALLTGGFVSGKQSGKRGWIMGGIQGIIYTLLLMIIGFLALDTSLRVNPIVFGICSFGLGALGGIVGVNMSRE